MVFLDIETAPQGKQKEDALDPQRGKIAAISIVKDGVASVYQRALVGRQGLIDAVLAIKDEEVVMHNALFDASFIRSDLGIALSRPRCTYIMSKILQNGKDFDNSLVGCLYYYLGVKEAIHVEGKKKAKKGSIQTRFSLKRTATDKEIEYITADTKHLPALYERLKELIEKGNFGKVLSLEEKLLPILVEIVHQGVRIDIDKLRHLIKRWTQAVRILKAYLDREIECLFGVFHNTVRPMFITYNYSSPKQLGEIFRLFGQPLPTKKEKGQDKVSFDYDSIQEYLAAYPTTPMRKFIGLLLKYKEYEKLRSTYGQAILDLVDANGYLHTTYRQIDTDTARLSSSRPNLQNLPSSGVGAAMRNCFMPDEGHLIVDVDMDAAEVRIAADKSKDPLLVDAIVNGADMHSVLASKIFTLMAGQQVEINKSKQPFTVNGHKFVPNAFRDFSKTGHFARLYKGGAGRMRTVYADYLFKLAPVDKHFDICQSIVKCLDDSMPGLTKWSDQMIEQGKERGFLREPKLGRIRYFSKDEYGSISNFLIQATNAEAMKIAIINAHKYLNRTSYGRILLTIHDQLVVSAVADKAEQVKEEIVRIMADAIGYFLDSIKGAASGKITKFVEK